jgi:hypothetical protein
VITRSNLMNTITDPLLACGLLYVTPAVSATASRTFTGVTTSNFVEAGDISTEFPVGTPWTAPVEWNAAAAPLYSDNIE